MGEDMEQRLVVVVHVHDEIGVVRQARQGQPQPRKLRVRREGGEGFAEGLADERDVRVGVLGQPALEGLRRAVGQVGPAAVEVSAAAQVGAADELAVEDLGEADRIGDRDDDDLAPDLALAVGLV